MLCGDKRRGRGASAAGPALSCGLCTYRITIYICPEGIVFQKPQNPGRGFSIFAGGFSARQGKRESKPSPQRRSVFSRRKTASIRALKKAAARRRPPAKNAGPGENPGAVCRESVFLFDAENHAQQPAQKSRAFPYHDFHTATSGPNQQCRLRTPITTMARATSTTSH